VPLTLFGNAVEIAVGGTDMKLIIIELLDSLFL
jgi:hypothetical protein